MTMPHLMNCPHSSDSWCLGCVKKEWEDNQKLFQQIQQNTQNIIAGLLIDKFLGTNNFKKFPYSTSPLDKIAQNVTTEASKIWKEEIECTR